MVKVISENKYVIYTWKAWVNCDHCKSLLEVDEVDIEGAKLRSFPIVAGFCYTCPVCESRNNILPPADVQKRILKRG